MSLIGPERRLRLELRAKPKCLVHARYDAFDPIETLSSPRRGRDLPGSYT